MNKYYVGQLSRAVTHLNVENKSSKVELVFNNGDFSEEMPFKLDHEYYVIEKSELDAYMTRKEYLEQMNCTPVWDAYERLRQRISSAEDELRAENERLKVNNAELTRLNEVFLKERSKLAEENEVLKERLNKFYSMCLDVMVMNTSSS